MTKRAVDIQQQADAMTCAAHELQEAARAAGGGESQEFLMQKSYEAIQSATALQSRASHADIEDEMGKGVTRTFPEEGVRRE